VREYAPLSEYGGWGLRYSVNHGKAYNVSGNQGVQLFFTNGKKLLIGTQKPEEITAILKQINQLKN
jgi:TATA-box binding protein (TBP) (component of TFIID and TFIIIB)